MNFLLSIQDALNAATPWLASAAVVFALMALGAHVAKRMPLREPLAQFKRLGLLWQVFIVLSVGSATKWAGAKGDRGVPTDPSQPSEPSIAPVSVHTNGVAFAAASSNAVEVSAWRTIGGTEMGAWIEPSTNAVFAVGTNPVSRAYAVASGAVSFTSMRRPSVGVALPDGTGLPVLCPLRTPLGFVPEANAESVFGQDLQDYQDFPATNNPVNPVNPVKSSRFWHDALPGGGRVLTWEKALVDRFPGRRLSMQVEMRPMGDSVFRYDFHDELDPPPTNFVMGAQVGTNGVNALAILGTNILSATVWNVDGAPVTNGVAIADLLCTNGVLRTPAAFEIRWRNTTGLNPVADTDGDGLTDWEEVFVWGTYPDIADTDGDGLADGGEVGGGTNPLDADENADGLPDGHSTAAWGANALWSTNAPDGSGAVTITLNNAIPAGTTATLVVGDLCIPLRSPGSWTFGLVPGQTYPYRLVVGGPGAADLSIGPEASPPLRGPMNEMSIALWLDGFGGAFDGWSVGGSGKMAVPTLDVEWIPKSNSASHSSSSGVCIHDDNEARFSWEIAPQELKTAVEHLQLENLCEDHQYIALSVDGQHEYVEGLAEIPRGHLQFGRVCAIVSAHLCDVSYSDHYCSVCGAFDYIYEEGHDIEHLTVLPADSRLVRSEVAFPGEQTRSFSASSSPVPDLHQPLFYEDAKAILTEAPFGVGYPITVETVAHINPPEEPPDNTSCSWRSLQGLSSSYPVNEWENTATFHIPTRGGVFKFRFQCDGFTDSDCFLVLPLAGASMDAIITREISNANVFAERVLQNHPWYERNSPSFGLEWFVLHGAGDFLGRPDNHSSPTVWYYNQVNDESNFGAIVTWFGRCVRLTKLSSFIDAYACQKIGVTALNQDLSQMIGTRNGLSGTLSWDFGVDFANGTKSLAECAEGIANACWNEPDEKVRRLWPNLAPADNFVEPDVFLNPNTQFSVPGFLRMENP